MKNQYKTFKKSIDIYKHDLINIIKLIDLRGRKNGEILNKILEKYNIEKCFNEL